MEQAGQLRGAASLSLRTKIKRDKTLAGSGLHMLTLKI